MYKIVKEIYQLLKLRSSHKKTVLFIVGCQRSGTSLTIQIFDRDLNTKVYEELSKLSSNDLRNKIRLNPLESVKKVVDKNKVPLIVSKPLVETQNSLKLLNYFQGSKALWMYRHYKDVASSNLTLFGIENGINNLRPIVENDSQNWRSENVPENVRKVVFDHFSEDMNPYDAAVRKDHLFRRSVLTEDDLRIIDREAGEMNRRYGYE